MKKKKRYQNRTKRVFQYAVIGSIAAFALYGAFSVSYSIDVESYCPFGGILSLGSLLWRGSMSCNMSELQVFLGLALVAGVMLFGKLFCAYVCPIGSVIEWLNRAVRRFQLNISLPEVWNRILRSGKYVLLFFTAYFTITASELWCRKYDPYYVAVTGFGYDTILFWGIVTLVAVVIGSVLIPFFWCKYVCPLAALSNIVENAKVTVPILVLYGLARFLGLELGILWLILALTLSGAITEIIGYKFLSITPFKIKLDHGTCSDCLLCDKACPQGIAVSQYTKVTHPDCNLCLDCVKACNVDGGIGLGPGSGRSAWLPPTAVITLFIAALLIANSVQFTTLSERWGNYESLATVKAFQMSDLRSVKCYGTSKSLQNKLVQKAGIVGLDTYAKEHRVVIYYDPASLDTAGIKEAVFTPGKYNLDPFRNDAIGSVVAYQVGIDGLLDAYDNQDLFNVFRQHPSILGFTTQFGEPVEVTVYFDPTRITVDEILAVIEQEEYIKEMEGGAASVAIDFKCEGEGTVIDTLNYQGFRRTIFTPADYKFNNYTDVHNEDMMIFEIDMPQAERSSFHRRAIYLVSHISASEGIVRFQTVLSDTPVARIYFVPAQVDSAQIHDAILSPVLRIHRSDGSIREMDNAYKFGAEARIIEANTAMH